MRHDSGTRWGVVGGGMLGLMLAHRLAQAGHRVSLFEAAPSLGGLASAWNLAGVTWDRHYHVILATDTVLRAALEELNLAQDLCWVRTRTGFYTGGEHHSMSTSWEFLRFPPLGLIDKFRLGATILYTSKVNAWKKLEGVLVEDWLRQWAGDVATEKIWLPLLRAKLGENYRRTSAAFIWATIKRYYGARDSSGAKNEQFGYVTGGYARIIDAFERRLRDEGVAVHCGHAAERVEPDETGGVRVAFRNGRSESFDQAALTVAAPVASRLCPGLTPREHELLNGIAYMGIVCASLLLRKPLRNFYVTNITDEWVPFTGVIEMSTIVRREVLGGYSLVYLPKYVDANDTMLGWSDEQVRECFQPALLRMYPELTPADIAAFRVSREKYVMAIPTLRYSERLPPITTSLPGVHIVNSAHIVNGTLNVNETLQLANREAARLALLPAARAAVTAAS